MTPNVPMSETGTATLGMKVERTLRRKTKTTRMTSAIEITIVIWTSRTEARIVRVASMTTDSVIVGGIDAWSCGSRARTRSTVSMMLAPGWRKTMINDRRLAVGEPSRPDVLDRVGHGGDVGEADGGAVAVVDDERPVLRGLQELVGRRERTRRGRRRRARPSAGWRWRWRGPPGRPRAPGRCCRAPSG